MQPRINGCISLHDKHTPSFQKVLLISPAGKKYYPSPFSGSILSAKSLKVTMVGRHALKV